MVFFQPRQHPAGCMGPFPDAGRIFIGLAHGGINMDSSQDLIETDTMLHGQHKFSDHLSGMIANNG